MLPNTVKPLREIAEYKDAAVRVPLLGTLLECLLKSITPFSDGLSLDPLLDEHRVKFRDFRGVDSARWVRNQIAHGTGKASTTQILGAEVSLDQAVREVLPYCSEQLRTEASGAPPKSKWEPPPQPPPQSASNAAPTFLPISSAPASSPPPPGPPTGPDRRSKPAAIWYVLAVVFLLVAAVVYFFGAPRSGPPTVFTAPPPVQAGPSPRVDSQPSLHPSSLPLPVEPKLSREDQFRKLINTNLSLSSSQPNVALLVDFFWSNGSSRHWLMRCMAPWEKPGFTCIGNLADLGR